MGPWATANYCRAGIKSLRGTVVVQKGYIYLDPDPTPRPNSSRSEIHNTAVEGSEHAFKTSDHVGVTMQSVEDLTQ